MSQAQLFFGDEVAGGGMVTPAQWQEFVDTEITPRYPGGFTIVTTNGQWRQTGGGIVRESGHELVTVQSFSSIQKLNEIRDAYKRRFRQESVLLAISPVCAGF